MGKVIVVGGGAAGMMAALAAAENGHRVVLYEKNEKLGKKLYITGKGRCNVTNCCGKEELYAHVVSNPKFLYSAFGRFGAADLMEMLERAGCPLKTERGGRVFPVSGHASDVTRAFARMLEKNGVQVCLHTAVEAVALEDNKITGVIIKGVIVKGKGLDKADAVIVAAGGMAYPATGSTGDAYRMAEQAGHTIATPKPALVPLELKEHWHERLQGVALKNVKVSLYDEKNKKKELYAGQGEVLFTHFGISGPLILSAASYYAKRAKEPECALVLDLKPALSQEQLNQRLLREFEKNQNKQFKNAQLGLFPAKIAYVMNELSGIDPEKKVHAITKEERLAFVHLIKHWHMTVAKTRGFEEAVITQGGISVKEVNPSTMESKKAKGLYFAGEALDLDALTGGFNLQIAWSTGFLAGKSIN